MSSSVSRYQWDVDDYEKLSSFSIFNTPSISAMKLIFFSGFMIKWDYISHWT